MGKSRKRGKIRPWKLNFRRLVVCAVVLAVAAGALKITHFFGDEETRDTVESGIVRVIDVVRECPAVPDEMTFLLDELAHRLPFVRGHRVDAGTLDATGLVLGGVPASAQPLSLLKNRGYLVGYDEETANPAWVAYKVFPPKNFETGARSVFEIDKRTRSRVAPGDYSHSGYDRGHMAPNQAMSVCYGEEAQRESFLMSNVVPQIHEVNAGLWKELEQRVLKRYTRAFGEVWVICGPLYDERSRAKRIHGKIAVPDAFFLIIVDCDEEHGNALRTLAFVIPHTKNLDGNARAYLTSIREIERRSGLDFFSALEPATQDALELKPAKTVW